MRTSCPLIPWLIACSVRLGSLDYYLDFYICNPVTTYLSVHSLSSNFMLNLISSAFSFLLTYNAAPRLLGLVDSLKNSSYPSNWSSAFPGKYLQFWGKFLLSQSLHNYFFHPVFLLSIHPVCLANCLHLYKSTVGHYNPSPCLHWFLLKLDYLHCFWGILLLFLDFYHPPVSGGSFYQVFVFYRLVIFLQYIIFILNFC